jgi:sulfate transport system substrate-binding protein
MSVEKIYMRKVLSVLLLLTIALTAGCPPNTGTLLNVSYDPTREFYAELNAAFIEYHKKETGTTARITMSHSGSSTQANAVVAGLKADVVTLALAFDIDHIAQHGLLSPDWQKRLPHNSTPYSSTVVFLVRKDNPKNIRDWDDLIRSDVRIVVAHPKTSGVARWAYLAGWGYVLKRELGDLSKLHDPAATEEVASAEKKAHEFITALYRNVVVLPTGARTASLAFVQQQQGDVLLDWENQAILTIQEIGVGSYEIIVPSVSILAEPPVAVVDAYVDRRGTRAVAEAYLKFLYSKEGQEIVAKHHYRPRDEEILAKYADKFVAVEMFTIDDVFGGWQKAQDKHFGNGGIFDQIYAPGR